MPDWHRFPIVPDEVGTREPRDRYTRDLNRTLIEQARKDETRLAEMEQAVAFAAHLSADFALTPNVLAAIPFDVVDVNTRGIYASGVYTPAKSGLYRCAWTVNLRDSVAIPNTIYGYSRLDAGSANYLSFAYGNGAVELETSGSAIVECDGKTTTVALSAFMATGATAPKVFAGGGIYGPLRSWLTVDFLGSR